MAEAASQHQPPITRGEVIDLLSWLLPRARHYLNWLNGQVRRTGVGDPAAHAVLAAGLGRYEGLDGERAAHVGGLFRRLQDLRNDWQTEDIGVRTKEGTSVQRRDLHLWLAWRRLARILAAEKRAKVEGERPFEGRLWAFVRAGLVLGPAESAVVVRTSNPRNEGSLSPARLAGNIIDKVYGRSAETLENINRFVLELFPEGSKFKRRQLPGTNPRALDEDVDAGLLVDALTRSDVDDDSTDAEILAFVASEILGLPPATVTRLVKVLEDEGDA